MNSSLEQFILTELRVQELCFSAHSNDMQARKVMFCLVTYILIWTDLINLALPAAVSSISASKIIRSAFHWTMQVLVERMTSGLECRDQLHHGSPSCFTNNGPVSAEQEISVSGKLKECSWKNKSWSWPTMVIPPLLVPIRILNFVFEVLPYSKCLHCEIWVFLWTGILTDELLRQTGSVIMSSTRTLCSWDASFCIYVILDTKIPWLYNCIWSTITGWRDLARNF